MTFDNITSFKILILLTKEHGRSPLYLISSIICFFPCVLKYFNWRAFPDMFIMFPLQSIPVDVFFRCLTFVSAFRYVLHCMASWRLGMKRKARVVVALLIWSMSQRPYVFFWSESIWYVYICVRYIISDINHMNFLKFNNALYILFYGNSIIYSIFTNI